MKEAEHLGHDEHEGYRVGQRIKHPQFGEGLVVDVRHGRASDVIEVVFGTELKRLSGRVRWPLAEDETAAGGAATAPAGGGASAGGPAAGVGRGGAPGGGPGGHPSRPLTAATPPAR